jgi:hypothetical protein
MYLSDFNMMLDNKLVDCFSEISLDKNKIDEINNQNLIVSINVETYEEKNYNKKLKKKIILNSNDIIYGKENKRITNRSKINEIRETQIPNNTEGISRNIKFREFNK